MRLHRSKYSIQNPARTAPAERNGRRVAAAARAIQRERDRMPLFAADVTTTVEERLDAIDRHREAGARDWRAYRAEGWRRARRWLRSIPEPRRAELIAEWNRGTYPGTPTYLLNFLHSRVRAEYPEPRP
jgi:lipopolysaccharide biosynthesis protein